MALPTNFTPEKKGKYTMSSLKSGETVKIRVMSDFISGKIVWSGHTQEEKKPFRVPDNTAIPTGKIGTNLRSGMPETIRQFVAAICWNYTTEQFEIFETDKATILERIYECEQDSDYGDSKGYDLKIGKKGQGMETKYSVQPAPPKPTEKDILTAFESQNIDLTALYKGEDPFNVSSDGNDVAQDVSDGLELSNYDKDIEDSNNIGEDQVPF